MLRTVVVLCAVIAAIQALGIAGGTFYKFCQTLEVI